MGHTTAAMTAESLKSFALSETVLGRISILLEFYFRKHSESRNISPREIAL